MAGYLGALLGLGPKEAGEGIKSTLEGIGGLATDIRAAFTGEIPPDVLVKLNEIEARTGEAVNRVNEEEAKSSLLFVAGWRPSIGWVCSVGLAYTFLVQPLCAWISLNVGWRTPPVLDAGALISLAVGMLGLGGMRSYEKKHRVHDEH